MIEQCYKLYFIVYIITIFIYLSDTLSGRVNSPQDTDTITKVIINILKHAKK